MTTSARPANRLAGETSPYLLQHAHNPVDWHPWGAEALERAHREDKPIFLSIGYSACHWCHVMERESFENADVAALMNAHFVCVKVDREERPDLDEIYMKATQTLSGHGGWPMSVWLVPDGRPFYAGTYFPPLPRWGQPGFVQVLNNLAQAWKSSREQVLGQAAKVAEHVAQMSLNGGLLPQIKPDARAPGLDLLDAACQQLLLAFDKEHGGFGDAPKFPHADDIRLLLRQAALGSDTQALHAAVHSLDCMARGGVYDQLGGGFHRYSTDERWWIPHFEKMLYDNALLVPALLEAARLADRPDFLRVARECCEWVLREMAGPHGGLSSTQDADSEGEEGKFFVWQRDEVLEVIGKQHAALVDTAYNLGDSPNFEGHAWALVRPRPDAELAAALKMSVEQMHAALEPVRRKLLERRARRVPPGTDDKVLVAWNGLMLGALARAGVALAEPRFVQAARRAADFCLTALRPDGRRLLATWRAGKAQHAGTLPDYAGLANGLLDLFEADGDPRWAREALALARVADEHFSDAERAGWYMTADDAETLFTRPRDLFDGAVPSGNGLMVEVCVRLFELTADEHWRSRAERALATVEPIARRSPTAFARMLLALLRLDAATTVVLAGAPDAPGYAELARVVAGRDPSAMVVPVPAAGVGADVAAELPLLAGKTARGGKAAAYVCRRGTCAEPALTAEALEAQLGA